METKGFSKFEIILNDSALSVSFEYLCYHGYGSTIIIKKKLISLRGSTLNDTCAVGVIDCMSARGLVHFFNYLYKLTCNAACMY